MKSISSKLIIQALILSLGAAVALGFARFSYALMLPAMRDTLEWTYAQAGAMNTANAVGYLIGAFSTAFVASKVGIARCFWVSLLLTGMSIFATGLSGHFTALLFFRLITGITCATTFISGATLASHLAKDGHGGLVLGLYFGGTGIGIFLSGLGFPQLLEYNAALWPYPWMIMGVLTVIFVLFARPVALSVSTNTVQPNNKKRWHFPRQLLPSLSAYFLFGLGYITYMTFIIAHLRSSGVSTSALTVFWLLLGISVFSSAFIWQRLLDKAHGSGLALATIMVVLAAGCVLPILSDSLIVIILSGMLVGGTFLSVVSSVTNIARCSLQPHAWAGGIALYTLIFSVGQTLGPVISGILADRSHNFNSGFALSATCLAIGALLALMQKAYDIE